MTPRSPSAAANVSAAPAGTSNRTIAVFGAYGHTARFVVSELCRRGWSPILSGRDPAKLQIVADAHQGSAARVSSIEEPSSVDRAMSGAVAVINCAGPFGETAPAIIEAALRAGIPYLDVTGEPFVTISTFERYSELAREAGIVVVPAMGFFGGLGDLLATAAMGEWLSADAISVAVALDSWSPTRGTRLAGERRAGRRVVRTGGRLVARSDQEQRPTATWDFPEPVGTQEVEGEFSTVDVVTISRHLDTPQIDTYLHLASTTDSEDTSGPAATDESGRSSQTFIMEAVARRAGEERRVGAHGRDIYAITAPIVVEAVERILDGRCKAVGLVAAGEIFDAEDFLRSLPLTRLSLPGNPAPELG
jgi:uncharacterized protein YbjT (DUF2867 family)